MKTEKSGLVVSRKPLEFVVIRHNNQELLLQVESGSSLRFKGPRSFRLIRSELLDIEMPETGNLVLQRTSGSQVIIDHEGEKLEVTFSERTKILCNGPRSFHILREELEGLKAA